MAALPSLFVALALLLPVVVGDGWLGVYLKVDEDQPVIEEVLPGSPASKVGLRPGDRVLAVDEKPCTSRDAFVAEIGKRNAGDVVKLKIARAREELVLSPRLGSKEEAQKIAEATPPAGERPRADAPKTATPNTGAPKTGAPAAAGRPYLGLELAEDETGVRIERVLGGGPAARSGLKRGEWVRQFGDRRIRSLADLEQGLRGLEPGRKLEVAVESDEGKRTVTVELGQAPGSDVAASPRAETRRPEPRTETAPKPEAVPAKPRSETRNDREEAKTEGMTEGKTEARSEGRPVKFGSDLAAARAQAATEKRPVLVVFGASWCASCQALKKAMQDASVGKALDRYVRVWIDTDDQGRLADEFDVQGLPHLEVLDASGKRVAKEIGYLAPERLQAFLESHAGTKAKPAEKAERSEKAEKAEKSEKAEKAEKTEKAETTKPVAKAAEPGAPAKTARAQPSVAEPTRTPGKPSANEVESLRAELEGLRAEIRELRELLRKLNDARR